MVLGPIIRQILVTVVYPIIVPLIKAQTQRFVYRMRRGIASGNVKQQFGKMFEEMANKVNVGYPAMSSSQAIKILSLDSYHRSNIDPKIVLDKYHQMVRRNDLTKGGSLYIQAKLYSAKVALLKDVTNVEAVEEQYIKQHGLDAQRMINQNKQKKQ